MKKCSFLLILANILWLVCPVMATLDKSSLISLTFPEPPEERETSDRGTQGGGTRSQDLRRAISSCTDRELIQVFIPRDQVLTSSLDHPSLFLYIPGNRGFTEANLILETESEQVEMSLELPETAQILQITLPEEVILEENKDYQWTITMECSLDNSDPVFTGMMRRTPLSLEQTKELENAKTPQEKAQLYAQFYLWEDTFTAMLDLREEQPEAWEEFLTSVNITRASLYQEMPLLVIQIPDIK